MNNYPQLNGNNPFEIFNYKNLGGVRVEIRNGEPWFCLKDICDILGLSNSRMILERINNPYVSSIYIGVQTGIRSDGAPAIQKVPMNFVNEAGLYQAIGQSRKPEAKRFMDWIFSEVLPSIRKTGSYSLEDDPSITPQTKILVNHERQIYNLNNHVSCLDNQVGCMQTDIDDHEMRLIEIEDTQVVIKAAQKYLIEEGSHTILQFSQYCGLNLSEMEKQKLGRQATSICKRNGLFMGSAKAGRFIAHTYPYPVLVEVFQEYVKSKSN